MIQFTVQIAVKDKTGEIGFFDCNGQCTEEQYEMAVHLKAAAQAADSAGYAVYQSYHSFSKVNDGVHHWTMIGITEESNDR